MTLSLTPGRVKSLTQRLTQHLILAGGGHGNMQGRGQVLSVKTRGQPGQRRECSTSTRQQHTSYVDTHADKEVQVNRRCESLSSGSGAGRMKAMMAVRWHKSCWRHVAPCRCGAGVGVSRCPHRSRCRRVFTVLVSPSSEHSSLHQPLCRTSQPGLH